MLKNVFYPFLFGILCLTHSSCRCLGDECINSSNFNFYFYCVDKKTGNTMPVKDLKVVTSTNSLGNMRASKAWQTDTFGVSFSNNLLDITHEIVIIVQDTVKVPVTLTLNKIEKSQCCPAYLNKIGNVTSKSADVKTDFLTFGSQTFFILTIKI